MAKLVLKQSVKAHGPLVVFTSPGETNMKRFERELVNCLLRLISVCKKEAFPSIVTVTHHTQSLL